MKVIRKLYENYPNHYSALTQKWDPVRDFVKRNFTTAFYIFFFVLKILDRGVSSTIFGIFGRRKVQSYWQ